MGVNSVFTADDYLSAMLSLGHQGRAWPIEPGTVRASVMAGLAQSYVRSGSRAVNLITDASPATTYELLTEWENTLGLPDSCTPLNPTIPQRQAAVLAKFIQSGSLSPAYYIALADALGYPVTITEFTPFAAGSGRAGAPIYGPAWAFAWQVNVAGVPDAPELVCRIGKNAPAETTVFFDFTFLPPGAPTGTPQHPDLFARYPTRPPWAVAGVDYRVGVNAGVTLTDWQAMTNPGIMIGAKSVNISNQTNVVVDSVDFSLHLGANLYFVNCQGITVRNCYFAGFNYLELDAGIIQTDPNCTDITIEYCELDGGGLNPIPIASISNSNPAVLVTAVPHGLLTGQSVGIARINGTTGMGIVNFTGTGPGLNGSGGQVHVVDVLTFTLPIDTTTMGAYPGGGVLTDGTGTLIFNQSQDVLTLHYNWIKHMPCRPLTMANAGTVDYKYNLTEQGAYQDYSHLNFMEWSSTSVDFLCKPTVEYNTIIQTVTVPANGEAYQTGVNGPATMVSPVIQYNTIIARCDNQTPWAPEMSYFFHLNGGTSYVTTALSGTLTCANNYFDASSAYGWYYPASAPSSGAAMTGNIDLITNQAMTADGDATITTLNIAPVVAGGTTVVSGVFANGQPGGVYLIVDGDSVTNTSDLQLAGGYSTDCCGFFSAAFDTPSTPGPHVVSVHTFGALGGGAASQFDVPFTVIAASAPYLTINTPASGATEGASVTINGTYVNAAPSGFTYNINGVGIQIFVSATIGGGAWSFTIPAPPTIFNYNGGNGGNTITVTGLGANTAQATSGMFTTIGAPSLTIVKPFDDFHATLALKIAGGYGGVAPSGLTYSVDGGPAIAAPSPTIGGAPATYYQCNWQFYIPAPPEGTHTISVHGTGPNTTSAMSDPFRTAAQIFVPGAPGVPASILVTPDLVALEWAIPTTGSPVDSYQLQVAPHGTTSWATVAAGTAGTSFIVFGLSLSTDYDFQVSATNLAGTSGYATNTAGVTTGAAFADGYAGRPSGVSAQLPSVLSGYPTRPSWNVAGVDYGVGYPSGTTLIDWSTMSGTGITVGASSVEISGQASVVVDSIDFSLHGGATLLLFTGSNNATVSNCKFGGTSLSTNSAIATDPTTAGLTVKNCVFNSGSTIGSCIWARGGGTILVEYCLSTYAVAPLLLLGDNGGTCTMQWNAVEGSSLYYGDNTSTTTSSPTIAFNTIYTNTTIGALGVGVQLDGNGGVIANASLNNNVMIATGTSSQGYWAGGAAVTGSGYNYENWIDSTGAYGPFYTGSFPGWIAVQNIDLPTDTVLAAP